MKIKENRAVYELTARLTLKSCVSQLTDFYTTNIQELFTDNGIEEISLTLCEPDGEVLPYRIYLNPDGASYQGHKFTSLSVIVYKITYLETVSTEQPIATFCFGKGKMKVSTIYKCALHCAGDLIKFSEKGI
jgi:hypothetical protein